MILYDDKILIFYNTDPNSPTTIDTTENKTICDQFNQNNAKENSLEPSGFKRVSLGGVGGRDALSRHHSAASVAKAVKQAMLASWRAERSEA